MSTASIVWATNEGGAPGYTAIRAHFWDSAHPELQRLLGKAAIHDDRVNCRARTPGTDYVPG